MLTNNMIAALYFTDVKQGMDLTVHSINDDHKIYRISKIPPDSNCRVVFKISAGDKHWLRQNGYWDIWWMPTEKARKYLIQRENDLKNFEIYNKNKSHTQYKVFSAPKAY